MRDYMKLLESMRICVCNRCSDQKNSECLASKEDDCKRELMAIAADAIEELLSSAQPEREACEEREQGLCPFYAR